MILTDEHTQGKPVLMTSTTVRGVDALYILKEDGEMIVIYVDDPQVPIRVHSLGNVLEKAK